MNKENYFTQHACDITKDKSLEQLLEFVGDFFCNETTHKSYKIIGLNKTNFICCYAIGMYDEDAFFGSGYYEEDGYIKVPFSDNEYVYSKPATAKQKEWLEKHNQNEDISGYEAWHIIHKAVEKAQKEYERRKYEYEHRWDYLEPDDDMYLCECYDVPNM